MIPESTFQCRECGSILVRKLRSHMLRATKPTHTIARELSCRELRHYSGKKEKKEKKKRIAFLKKKKIESVRNSSSEELTVGLIDQFIKEPLPPSLFTYTCYQNNVTLEIYSFTTS